MPTPNEVAFDPTHVGTAAEDTDHLESIDVANFSSGSRAYVKSIDLLYVLDKDSLDPRTPASGPAAPTTTLWTKNSYGDNAIPGRWREECSFCPGGTGPGAVGPTGPTGPTGGSGSSQVAEFVQNTQGSNASIAPGRAVSYLVDNPAGVVNTIGIGTATGPAAQGTSFNLPIGTYLVDFENSADAAWSLAIYRGGSSTVLAIDNNTIAGASTATTWIHGRAYVTVTAVGVDDWLMISPVVGTQAIPTAGTAAGFFTARITFLKLT